MADPINLAGIEKVVERLKTVAREVKVTAARKALAKAARLITNEAKAGAERSDDPKTGRKISQNIQQRFASKTFKQTGDVMYRIGVATARGPIPKGNPDEGPKGNTPQWHLIELGTEHAAAEPFLRPAGETKAQAAADVFMSELDKQLDKLLK